MTIEMLREGWFAPTLNLERPTRAAAASTTSWATPRRIDAEYVMNNNFAFGGVNTSLVFRRADGGLVP